jgi:hypothetical protein
MHSLFLNAGGSVCQPETHTPAASNNTSTVLLLTCHIRDLCAGDCRRCTRVSCAALLELLQGCKQLRKLVLPLQLDLEPLLSGLSHSLEQDEEQERQVLLLHQRTL